jgi:hypothetical protein
MPIKDNPYDEGRKTHERVKFLQEHMEKPGTVLDFGANTGLFSHGLARAGFKVTTVEPPNEKKYNTKLVKEHRVLVKEPSDLPDGPFDYALVLSVLHHIPNWQAVLDGVLERTTRAVFVELPSPRETHPTWHGAAESRHYVSALPNAEVIGSFPEMNGVHYRDMWRITR